MDAIILNETLMEIFSICAVEAEKCPTCFVSAVFRELIPTPKASMKKTHTIAASQWPSKILFKMELENVMIL